MPDSLHVAFDMMILDPSSIAPDNFSDEWGASNTEEALALSGVDDARLKYCIVAALALGWGVLTMHQAQLKAYFCLLHPHWPNMVVVFH